MLYEAPEIYDRRGETREFCYRPATQRLDLRDEEGTRVFAAQEEASRARRRVRAENTVPDADLGAQREVVDAFLAAARDGDFDRLVAVLDPDVVLRQDFGAGRSREVRGVAAVARQAAAYARIELVGKPALINGAVGVVVTRDGQPFSVGAFTVRRGRIVEMDWLLDRERLRELDLTIFDD
jgi:hypothetical protein